MDKSKIADKEIEVAKWMNKKGYDRRASKDVAPIIVEYLREFKLLNLHIVSNNEVAVCMCEDDWNANDIELTCKHCKKPIEFQQTDC